MEVQIENRRRGINPRKEQTNKVGSGGFYIPGLNKKATDSEKLKFYSSLSILLNAGMDIGKSLELVEEQNISRKWTNVLPQVNQNILKGDELSKALEKTGLFNDYELISLKIGEETGFLTQFIDQLADHYEDKIKLRRMIINTFSYPAIVLIITMGTLYFMLKFIVPMFANIFKRFNKELPELTQTIIDLSDFVSTKGWMILLVVVSLVILHTVLKQLPKYRAITGQLVLATPLIGTTVQKVQVARFSSAMHYLIKSETPLVHSLELTAKMISFYPLKLVLKNAAEKVMNGMPLYDALKLNNVLPPTVIALIKVGEEVNQLEIIFYKMAQQYQKEVEHQAQVVSKVLEPLLIMVVAGIVGVVLIAMYLPLFNLSNVI